MAPPIIKRFWISLSQNAWLGLMTTAGVIGIAAVIATQPPPIPPRPTFSVVGQLSLRTPPPAFTSTGTQLQQQGKVITREMLLSYNILKNTADKLKLTSDQILVIRDKRLLITFPKTEDSSKEAVSDMIQLELTDPDSAAKAQLILNTLMQEMVNYSRWLNTSQLRSRIEALTQRLSKVQKDLRLAESRFYQYISKQGAGLLAIQDGSLFTGITSSQQQQRDLNLQLQEIDGQIKNLVKQLGLTPEQAYTAVALSADPILGNLRARILNTELELERLKLDLRPEHPTLIKLMKEKKSNEKLLEERAKELIGRQGLKAAPNQLAQIRQDSSLDPRRQQLASQLLVLQTQRAGIVQQLQSVVKTEQELRQQYEKFPDQQLTQARLVQAVEFQRVVYQNILTALADAQSAEAETTGSLAIALPATVQPLSERQRRIYSPTWILIGGIVLGILAGLGIILLLALLDDRLHTPEEIRTALAERDVMLLGQLPVLPKRLLHNQEVPALVSEELDSVYLAFYERLRSNLRYRVSDSPRVILVTSVSEQEGKSLTAYNLAIAAANADKRTLLIEADLRTTSKADWLEIDVPIGVQKDPLQYYANSSESIYLVPSILNLYILPSPGPLRQPVALLESSEMQLLLKDIRGRFDFVIIDTPPLSHCNDALLLEPASDGLLMVTRPGYTRSSLFREAIDQFIEAEIPVLGAVINGVEDLFVLSLNHLREESAFKAEQNSEDQATITEKIEV
ncbi:MAG: AAA family ATPase [Woronichinia naegeliana WA131]|jgi:capsular exopolysaccharide synthesis family protein|uniref:AAA family ATPase n=2 Tax=Cyanophyceae TaxID=3028117 RepID=A0A977PU29_9CYAN|nr:MAG: AAA family ATPase [Woronichinia naegeliana WA131]